MENARAAAGVFFLAVVVATLSGCANLFPQTAELRNGLPAGLPEHVEMKSVPFFPQTEYQCGPAALATALDAFGAKVTPEQLASQVYLPERRGSLQVEMLAAARRHGFVSYVIEPKFPALLRELAAGNPVIILQDYAPFGTWHYAVAVGYDYNGGFLVLRSGIDKELTLTFPAVEFTWKRSGYWAMLAMPPDRIPATVNEERWLASIAALEHAGDASNARTAYETFLKRWPDNVNAAIGLANTHYALHELPAAEAVLREAAKRDPDSVIVMNNLAQTLSDENRNEEALPIIERALAAGGPYSQAVQETRKTILERLGKQPKN